MQSASAIQIPENISLLLFACSSPPVFLFCKKPFCAFAFHNSNYIISACPGMLVGRLFDLLLYFTAFLSAYPVKSLFYSFAAAYSSAHPSTNAVCTPIPCACTLCIVQKSSTKIVFPVLRWHCCKVPAYWCLSCLCILSICFYKRVVRKVI